MSNVAWVPWQNKRPTTTQRHFARVASEWWAKLVSGHQCCFENNLWRSPRHTSLRQKALCSSWRSCPKRSNCKCLTNFARPLTDAMKSAELVFRRHGLAWRWGDKAHSKSQHRKRSTRRAKVTPCPQNTLETRKHRLHFFFFLSSCSSPTQWHTGISRVTQLHKFHAHILLNHKERGE